VLDPYHGIERGWNRESLLAMIEETIQLEGSHTIAGFILETVTGRMACLFRRMDTWKECGNCATSTAS